MGKMLTFKAIFGELDISTRQKRKRIVDFIITELENIRNAEQVYMERVPINFRDGESYANAEMSIDTLTEGIDILADAYSQ